MPVSNPSAAAAAVAPLPDIQQLVALLGSLMPLLLRFQSQAAEQPFQAGLGSLALGSFGLGLGNVGLGNVGLGQPGLNYAGLGQPGLGQDSLGHAGFGNLGLGNALIPNPALDHQAAASLVADITADALRNLSAYLEANVGQHPGLQTCVPIVTQAARSFAAHGHAQAFDLIWQVYRLIATVRAADPQIPPLRTGGQTFSTDPISSIH